VTPFAGDKPFELVDIGQMPAGREKNLKVKFSLQRVMKSQRRSRGIALLFL
jgi:hypothetical protein